MLQFRFRCPCCRHLHAACLTELGQSWGCPQTGQPLQLPPNQLLPSPQRGTDLPTINVPDLLLNAFSGLGGVRERRLALAAVGHAMIRHDDAAETQVADIAERQADERATLSEVNWARRRVEEWLTWPTHLKHNHRRAHLANLYYAALMNVDWYELAPPALHLDVDRRFACDVIRDVYGRWSHTLLIRESWLTANDGAAAKVARAIYDAKRFSELVVLGDALLEGGCDDHALLRHLRGTGPHVRGCWALDAVLGKLSEK